MFRRIECAPGMEKHLPSKKGRLKRAVSSFFGESGEMKRLRSLMKRAAINPSSINAGEISEIGFIFRSLSRENKGAFFEIEVFYCLSRILVCSNEPASRAAAKAEISATRWRIRHSLLQTFLNTS